MDRLRGPVDLSTALAERFLEIVERSAGFLERFARFADPSTTPADLSIGRAERSSPSADLSTRCPDLSPEPLDRSATALFLSTASENPEGAVTEGTAAGGERSTSVWEKSGLGVNWSAPVDQQIVNRNRVADHGEVFTRPREVSAVGDLVHE